MAWEKELPKDSPFSFLLYPAHQELSGWQSSFPRNTNRGRSVQNRDTCIPVTLNKQVNQHLEAFGLSLNLLWVWLLSPVSGYTNNISGDPDPPNTGLALWVQAKWSQALQNKNNDWTISTTSVIGIIFGDPSHTLASLYNKRKFLWKQNIWILVVLALIHANVNKPFRIVSQNNLLCFKPVSWSLSLFLGVLPRWSRFLSEKMLISRLAVFRACHEMTCSQSVCGTVEKCFQGLPGKAAFGNSTVLLGKWGKLCMIQEKASWL